MMTEEKILNWIDAKTDDEFWTPLHYGSFSGNLDAVYVLLENGARMEELNS
jgi:ankyrin repeat protein